MGTSFCFSAPVFLSGTPVPTKSIPSLSISMSSFTSCILPTKAATLFFNSWARFFACLASAFETGNTEWDFSFARASASSSCCSLHSSASLAPSCSFSKICSFCSAQVDAPNLAK